MADRKISFNRLYDCAIEEALLKLEEASLGEVTSLLKYLGTLKDITAGEESPKTKAAIFLEKNLSSTYSKLTK
jgi:hypothetical protein